MLTHNSGAFTGPTLMAHACSTYLTDRRLIVKVTLEVVKTSATIIRDSDRAVLISCRYLNISSFPSSLLTSVKIGKIVVNMIPVTCSRTRSSWIPQGYLSIGKNSKNFLLMIPYTFDVPVSWILRTTHAFSLRIYILVGSYYLVRSLLNLVVIYSLI